MRRLLLLAVPVASLVIGVADGPAMHAPGDNAGGAASSGFPWHSVLLWGGIGVGIALLLGWLAVEGRRHHWHLPHRPVHA